MSPSALRIPSAKDIDPDWLTACLRQRGYDVQVGSFQAARVGTGQIGMCVRYALHYTSGEGPISLVGKFPSDDPGSRHTGVVLQNFLKEVRFYQTLQPHLSIRTPRCYFSEIQDQGPTFFLLLEDLAPSLQGDQLSGCTGQVAERALSELVGLHAPSWSDERLKTLDWLHGAKAEAGLAQDLYQAQMPGFIARFGQQLDADEIALIREYGAAQDARRDLGLPEFFSIIHGDYRLDNLLIGGPSETPSVTAVDWQTVALGNPLTDVAYFVGAGLTPEVRRPIELNLVQGYHQGLVEAGVRGFSWDACWRSYRLGAFAGITVAVIAAMLVQRTERGDRMFLTMAKRHARHALDLRATELLP